MKTAVMTDSNSGITAAEGKELGVFIVPMPVIIDGVTYFEGKNLLQPDFFESLMSGKDVSTSQPSPGDLMELWNRVLALGYDDIVYIPMSSGLSNSYASAAVLAEEYDHRVHVVDNHRISIPQLASVMDAVKLVSEGRTAGEIKELLEKAALEASIYIAVDTLESVSYTHLGNGPRADGSEIKGKNAETGDTYRPACRAGRAGGQ